MQLIMIESCFSLTTGMTSNGVMDSRYISNVNSNCSMGMVHMVGKQVLMWFFKKKEVPELNYENAVDIYLQNLLAGGQSVGDKKNVRDDSENS